MGEALLNCVEIGEGREASVIWLHGLGADGHDFEPIVPELGIDTDRVRFIFPHAPSQPVTLNDGMTVLTFDLGTTSRDLLQEANYSVTWHEYPMQHQICLEEIRAVGGWLREVLLTN